MSLELRCVQCNEYLFNGPIQCSCGDRLCSKCYSILSENAKAFQCVKCKEEIYVNECFEDRAATLKLKKATLECVSPGCSWKGNSDEYKIHAQKCTGLIVLCKYGCLGMQSPVHLPVPLHEAECPFMQCQWCSKAILKIQVDTHIKNACEHHQVKECEFKEAGCQFIGHAKDLEEHYVTNMKKHLQLTKQSIQRVKKATEVQMMMLSEQLSDLRSDINHLNREISVKLQPMASAVGNAETAIHNLQKGFSELALMVQTLRATIYNGTFIWKIPEVQRRRHEAKINKTISLYSVPFYTSRQGYKACLRLYMDGNGCGKNTHLSFFVTIMKGEYDALLQWPFRHTVTLTLLDQDGVKNISQTFQPEPTSSSFQRPRNEMNTASGCPMFAPLSVLNNSSYVKEDTMFLRCAISNV